MTLKDLSDYCKANPHIRTLLLDVNSFEKLWLELVANPDVLGADMEGRFIRLVTANVRPKFNVAMYYPGEKL